jgi:hypothetical protein
MTDVFSVTPFLCLPVAEKNGLFKQFCTDPAELYCVITEGMILFTSEIKVLQQIESERRTLNSVYHTAGDILNDAVLQLNDELGIEEHGISKAHFCEVAHTWSSMVSYLQRTKDQYRGKLTSLRPVT